MLFLFLCLPSACSKEQKKCVRSSCGSNLTASTKFLIDSIRRTFRFENEFSWRMFWLKRSVVCLKAGRHLKARAYNNLHLACKASEVQKLSAFWAWSIACFGSCCCSSNILATCMCSIKRSFASQAVVLGIVAPSLCCSNAIPCSRTYKNCCQIYQMLNYLNWARISSGAC